MSKPRLDDNIIWLQVAVNYAALVQVVHRIRDLRKASTVNCLRTIFRC